MNPIENAYLNALLADATYALNNESLTGFNQLDLYGFLRGRMTDQVAKYISDNFTVVSNINTSEVPVFGSGFDATVWVGTTEEVGIGKVYVSTRGTDFLPNDLLNDLDLTINHGVPSSQIVDMVNWWMQITTPVGEQAIQVKRELNVELPLTDTHWDIVASDSVSGLGLVSGSASITVNGHSLGGNLASSFARLFSGKFNITEVNTFNSAGFNPNSEDFFAQVAALLPPANGTYGYSNHNYFAENGISATTREFLNIMYGQRISLSQENSAMVVPNHYMYKLTDLLALGDTMVMLDPTLDFSILNKIIDTGSNKTEASIEKVIDALRKIVGIYTNPVTDATPIGDVDGSVESRKEFYENLFELKNNNEFKNLMGKILITNETISTNPRVDYSHFLSLYFLTPFSVVGVESLFKTLTPEIYALWFADINLSAEDRKDGKANFSDSWYTDRASMLAAQNARNTADDDNDLTTNTTAHTIYYSDVVSNSIITSESPSGGDINIIKFGDAVQSNELDGGYYDDHIYGGSKNDILKGHEGDDILVGGKGADQLEGGIGDDTLKAIDGATTDTLIGGQGDDTYYIDFIDNVTDTIIENANEGVDTVYVNTSIELSRFTNVENVKLFDSDENISRIGYETFTGSKVTGNDLDNNLTGNAANNIILGGKGNDVISGGKGRDLLNGGTGNDVYFFARGDALGDGTFGSGDKIIDTDLEAAGNIDTIRFDSDITPDDVRYWTDGTTFYLNIPSTGDVISMPWRAFQASNSLVAGIGGFGGWGSAAAACTDDNIDPFMDFYDHWYASTGAYGFLLQSTGLTYNYVRYNPVDRIYGGVSYGIHDGIWDPNTTYTIETGQTPHWNYGSWDGYYVSPMYNHYYDTSYGYLSRQGDNSAKDYSDYYAVEKVEFADGTTWNIESLANFTYLNVSSFSGRSEPEDFLNAEANYFLKNPLPGDWNWGGTPVVLSDDTFEGGDGDDNTSTGAGTDSLNGRKGNDILNGGSGNDVYLFAKGDGRDTIKDYDNSPGNSDIIRFAADVLVSDVIAYRDTNNLYLKNTTNTDVITIENWFTNSSYRVEHVLVKQNRTLFVETFQS